MYWSLALVVFACVLTLEIYSHTAKSVLSENSSIMNWNSLQRLKPVYSFEWKISELIYAFLGLRAKLRGNTNLWNPWYYAVWFIILLKGKKTQTQNELYIVILALDNKF